VALGGLDGTGNQPLGHSLQEMLSEPGKLKQLSEDDLIRLVRRMSEKGMRWPVVKIYSLLGGNFLSADARRQMEKAVIGIVLEVSHRIGVRLNRKTYLGNSEYQPGLDEIDEDLTLENLAGKRRLDHQDIVYLKRSRKPLAVAVMMDISGSMCREKVVLTAIAGAVLLSKYRRDYCALIAFAEKPRVIKHALVEEPLTSTVQKILHLEAGGSTNTAAALDEGLAELERAEQAGHLGDKIGILITDGWSTAGENPRHNGLRFPRLNVVQVGVGGGSVKSTELCRELALGTGGKYSYLDSYDEIPHVLAEAIN